MQIVFKFPCNISVLCLFFLSGEPRGLVYTSLSTCPLHHHGCVCHSAASSATGFIGCPHVRLHEPRRVLLGQRPKQICEPAPFWQGKSINSNVITFGCLHGHV